MTVYTKIESHKKKKLAVLIDPDSQDENVIEKIAISVEVNNVDFVFIGGSLLLQDYLDTTIRLVKKHTKKPIVLFPGSTMQINPNADAILFLSLISGRNPEMLIGNHVVAAPYIKAAKLEVIPTGYMLVESGKPTAASYMSGTIPIPHDKDDIAISTAVAGEMLGLKAIYLDCGSGAKKTASSNMIKAIKNNISIPLIVGGGIRSSEKAVEVCQAGADVIVVGNAVMENSSIIAEIGNAIQNI